MKNAEEWIKDAGDYSKVEIPLCDDLSPLLVRQIQLDAFKAGAEWAANTIPKFFCESHDRRYAARETRDRIIAEISNLKEIPK